MKVEDFPVEITYSQIDKALRIHGTKAKYIQINIQIDFRQEIMLALYLIWQKDTFNDVDHWKAVVYKYSAMFIFNKHRRFSMNNRLKVTTEVEIVAVQSEIKDRVEHELTLYYPCLSKEENELLNLLYVYGYSTTVIANYYGIGRSAVNMRKVSIEEKIRKYLRGEPASRGYKKHRTKIDHAILQQMEVEHANRESGNT